MAISETMRQMAEAVRQGDEAAALALADALQEGRGDGMALQLPRVAVIGKGARAMLFVREGWRLTAEEAERLPETVALWLDGEARVVVLPRAVERVEIYCKENA